MRQIHIIINPASGQDEPVLATLNRELDHAGIHWTHSVTKASGDAARLATAAAKDPNDAIAVYGGDGTVSEVASAIAESGIPLAILPGGTGNVIAAELGIEPKLEQAVASLASGEWVPRKVDALDLDGRLYLLRVGIGSDARMIERADRDQKNQLGWLAYLQAAVAEASTEESAQYRIEVDGETHEIEAEAVIVANIGRVGRSGLRISSCVDPHDGLLDVLVIRRIDLPAWVSIATSFLGLSYLVEQSDTEPVDEPTFLHLKVEREIRISADPPQPIQADGELLGLTPLAVKLRKAQITILGPPPHS